MQSTTDKTTLVCSIPPGAIKAALLFAASAEIRGYLVGACVEHGPLGVRLIASDGHRLICIHVEDGNKSETPVRYVVARDILATAVKLHSKALAVNFEWQQERLPDPERPGVTIVKCARVTVGGIQTTDLQDTCGKYPEYERTIPREVSGKVAQYNASYLFDCARAYHLLTGHSAAFSSRTGVVEILHNDTGPGFVPMQDKAIALVMPFRGGAKFSLPAWFTGTIEETKAAA